MVDYPSGINVYTPKIADEALVRKFVSQNGQGYVAIQIYNGTTAVDPDAGTLQLQVWYNDPTTAYPVSDDPRGTLVLTATADQINRADTGMYDYTIGPQYTGQRGVLNVIWTYQVSGNPFTFNDYMQILDQMPLYNTLSDAERSVVEQVSWMIGDLFDSTTGGPHLIDEFQTHFDYERLAQLARISTYWFNTMAQPVTNYTFGEGGSIPSDFSGLTVLGTYLEVVRHLMRSYVEIPAWQQMNVTFEDRRDYLQRWKEIYDSQWPDYQKSVTLAKRSLLNLGRGSLLLGGGYFGGGGMRSLFLFSPYNAATRAFRFYPAAPAISFPSTRIP